MLDSPHSQWMAEHGYENARPNNEPLWSGATGGVIPGDEHRVWRFGGLNTSKLLLALPLEDRNLVCLSHADQVIAYCCVENGVQINNLITLMGPVRKDMEEHYRGLVNQVAGQWVHVHAQWWKDKMQLLGALFDKGLRYRRAMKIEGVEDVQIKGVSHSSIVRNPEHFDKLLGVGFVQQLN